MTGRFSGTGGPGDRYILGPLCPDRMRASLGKGNQFETGAARASLAMRPRVLVIDHGRLGDHVGCEKCSSFLFFSWRLDLDPSLCLSFPFFPFSFLSFLSLPSLPVLIPYPGHTHSYLVLLLLDSLDIVRPGLMLVWRAL